MAEDNHNSNSNTSGQQANTGKPVSDNSGALAEPLKELPVEGLSEDELAMDDLFDESELDEIPEDYIPEEVSLSNDELSEDDLSDEFIEDDLTEDFENIDEIDLGKQLDNSQLTDEEFKYAEDMDDDLLTEEDFSNEDPEADATDFSPENETDFADLNDEGLPEESDVVDNDVPDEELSDEDLDAIFADSEEESAGNENDDVFADIFSDNSGDIAELDEQEKKILELQEAFEKTCNGIQSETDSLLSKADPSDQIKQTEILDAHENKLKKALDTLETELDKISGTAVSSEPVEDKQVENSVADQNKDIQQTA